MTTTAPTKTQTTTTQSNAKPVIKQHIAKTCPYNVAPLKPHFYIIKLGFTGVYIIFLISVKNIDCGYSLEPPRRGGSNEYPKSMFWAEIWKISEFLSGNFHFLVVKFSVYLNRRVFVMNLKPVVLEVQYSTNDCMHYPCQWYIKLITVRVHPNRKHLMTYEGPAKSFVTAFGLLQCYVLSNIFLLQTFKVFLLFWNTFL